MFRANGVLGKGSWAAIARGAAGLVAELGVCYACAVRSVMPRAQLRMCARLLLALACASACAACATVQPYERERLSKRDMRLDGDPDASAGESHAVAYREGSSGATGMSGGGCGCN